MWNLFHCESPFLWVYGCGCTALLCIFRGQLYGWGLYLGCWCEVFDVCGSGCIIFEFHIFAALHYRSIRSLSSANKYAFESFWENEMFLVNNTMMMDVPCFVWYLMFFCCHCWFYNRGKYKWANSFTFRSLNAYLHRSSLEQRINSIYFDIKHPTLFLVPFQSDRPISSFHIKKLLWQVLYIMFVVTLISSSFITIDRVDFWES